MSRNPDRLVLFTDAVVAIAITLLVLPLVEIVAEPAAGHPSEMISHHWRQIFSFLLSFFVIAQLWLTHHRMFENVRQYSQELMSLNILWLLTIVVLPIPTALVGTYGDERFAQFFYVGTILVSSVLLSAIRLLIHGNPSIAHETDGLSPRVVLAVMTPTFLLLLALLLVPVLNYYGLLLMLLSPVIVRFTGLREAGTAR
jgi:uncharacterized membrane protein